MLNAFRVALIAWTVAVAVSQFGAMGFAFYSALPQLTRPLDTAPQGEPFSHVPPTVPADVAAAAAGPAAVRHGLLAAQPLRRAQCSSRLFTVWAIGVVAFAVVGLMVLIALWVWIGAVDLPELEDSGYSVAMAVLYGVLVVGDVAKLAWDYRRSSSELRSLKAEDARVDLSLFSVRSLLCCCPQHQRRSDGFDDSEVEAEV